MKTILYVQYSNPGGYPPMINSSRILANNGYKVIMLGVKEPNLEGIDVPEHENINVELYPNKQFETWNSWIEKRAEEIDPDFVFNFDFYSCPVAVELSKKFPIIYHEHDYPPVVITKNQIHSFKKRAELAKIAKAFILPDPNRLEEFKEELSPTGRGFFIANFASLEDISPKKESDSFDLIFFGSINSERVPYSLIPSLRALPFRLILVGYETEDGFVEKFSKDIEEKIDFVGKLSRDKGLEKVELSSLGWALVSDHKNFKHQSWASCKIFDYMAKGVPFLYPNKSGFEKFSPFGKIAEFNNAESITTAISWFLEHHNESKEMGLRAQKKIRTDWNYEKAFSPVMEFIRS